MSKLYRSREGTIITVDTKTQLTTLGSETAPGPLLVPAGAKRLAAIILAYATSQVVVADGSVILRIEGPGLPEGPETLVVGSQGVAIATGGHGSRSARRIELDIPVVAANEILLFGENVGEDVGNVTVGATLEFTM